MNVADQLRIVLHRIAAAAASSRSENPIRLIAVSKTQPVSSIRAAYDAGQRHFGENYIAELVEKAGLLPEDMRWHFIGRIQKNKAKRLLSCQNLSVVESLDSEALADALQRLLNGSARTIDVYIQVKTSDEDSKSGCSPDHASSLAHYVMFKCPNLRFQGLMTIGQAGNMGCFSRLLELRRDIAQSVGMSENDLALSMGMSNDFEKAIELGSTSVRVGSAIFGPRPANSSRI